MIAKPGRSKRIRLAGGLLIALALALEFRAGTGVTDHPFLFLTATLAGGILLGQWARPKHGHFISQDY